jgi:Ca2+-binding EF-hand superfamily protein
MGNWWTTLPPFPIIMNTTSEVTDSLEEADRKELSKKTGFTYRQVDQLYERFEELLRLRPKPKSLKADENRSGKDDEPRVLTKETLELIPELKVNPLADRIVAVFISYAESTNAMTRKEFVSIMAKFRGTSGASDDKKMRDEKREEKMRFLFKIYDTKGDANIDSEELEEILSKILPKTDKKKISQNADKMIDEMDFDGDKKISFADFAKTFEGVDIDTQFSLPFLRHRDF